jgi:thiol:disulfide interchange protein DsbC
VKGNGKRRLAVFTDPNCPYCKNLEKEMVNLTDATVYIFVLPMLPGSEEKAKAIWCSLDRLSAWEDIMLRAVEPQPKKACDTAALDKISTLAKRLKINVTPTMIFEDGVIQPSALTLDQIDKRFTASSPNK